MSLPAALTLATAGVLAQFAVQPCAAPALSSTSMDLWIANRVLVSTRSGDPRDVREGVGLLVGWESKAPRSAGLTPGPPREATGTAWIAVPAHVLFGTNTSPDAKALLAAQSSVEVRWTRDDAPARPCAGTRPTPPEHDVTFICVEWNGRPFFWQSMEASQVEPGMPLALLAPGLEAPIEGRVLRAASDDAVPHKASSPHGVIPAEGLLGEPGMSGSPVAAPSGVVGIYQGRGVAPTVRSLHVIKRLAAATGVPWSLTAHEFFDCRRTRQVCATTQGHAAPGAIALTGSAGRYSIDFRACADVPEGKYLVLDEREHVVCEPQTVSVHGGSHPLRLSLSCAPNLTGVWEGPGGRVLFCSGAGMRGASCSGLEALGMGIFSGRLVPLGNGLAVNGSFRDAANNARPASGRFTWRDGVLTGEIARAGYPGVAIELRRVR